VVRHQLYARKRIKAREQTRKGARTEAEVDPF
jgi:hypothetical protein